MADAPTLPEGWRLSPDGRWVLGRRGPPERCFAGRAPAVHFVRRQLTELAPDGALSGPGLAARYLTPAAALEAMVREVAAQKDRAAVNAVGFLIVLWLAARAQALIWADLGVTPAADA